MEGFSTSAGRVAMLRVSSLNQSLHPRINHGRHPTFTRRRKSPSLFNIVVADKRVRRDGRFIERIGFYNPIAAGGEEGLRIAQDRLSYWVGVGAQTSPTVDRLIKQAGKVAA